jgi:hypothetical protein
MKQFVQNVRKYGLGVVLSATALTALPALAQSGSSIDVSAATSELTTNKPKLIEVAVVVFGIAALIMILRKIRGMFR